MATLAPGQLRVRIRYASWPGAPVLRNNPHVAHYLDGRKETARKSAGTALDGMECWPLGRRHTCRRVEWFRGKAVAWRFPTRWGLDAQRRDESGGALAPPGLQHDRDADHDCRSQDVHRTMGDPCSQDPPGSRHRAWGIFLRAFGFLRVQQQSVPACSGLRQPEEVDKVVVLVQCASVAQRVAGADLLLMFLRSHPSMNLMTSSLFLSRNISCMFPCIPTSSSRTKSSFAPAWFNHFGMQGS